MALHSDHVNYLVFRYLQESGLEKTARSLHAEWQRPYEHRDPESLPFAPIIRRGELISVLQNGLWHDELLAQVNSTKGNATRKQFRWTAIDPRGVLAEGAEGQHALYENGTVPSRPSTGEKRKKGRLLQSGMRAPDEFPTPPPKRVRRSEGSEGVHLNGEREAMDVDAASPSLMDAEGEDDPDVVSPEGQEVMEVPERYDSMDVATQTDVKAGVKTSTMYWSVDKADATILHGAWNPSPEQGKVEMLFTGGESLCRFYGVPAADMDSSKQPLSREDFQNLPPNSVITAAAWHPRGQRMVCAVDSARGHPPEEGIVGRQSLIEHTLDGHSTALSFGLPTLEPGGIVLCVQYNITGTHLLILRTNLKTSLVQVWDTRHHGDANDTETDPYTSAIAEPIAWHIYDRQVLDACWATHDQFVVTGEEGWSSVHAIDNTAPPTPTSVTTETVTSRGLLEQTHHLDPDQDKKRSWSRVCAPSDASGRVALASADDRTLMFAATARGAPDDGSHASVNVVDLPGTLKGMAFRPVQSNPEDGNDSAETTLFLATAFEEGFCTLYSARWLGSRCLSSTECARVRLAEGQPALALAWSPDGDHLAVAGTDVVQIWDAESLLDAKQRPHQPEAVVTWRCDALGVWKHEEEELARAGDMSCQPSLSWSADGKRVAFAVERQVSVCYSATNRYDEVVVC